jgi:hypothetical protein
MLEQYWFVSHRDKNGRLDSQEVAALVMQIAGDQLTMGELKFFKVRTRKHHLNQDEHWLVVPS